MSASFTRLIAANWRLETHVEMQEYLAHSRNLRLRTRCKREHLQVSRRMEVVLRTPLLQVDQALGQSGRKKAESVMEERSKSASRVVFAVD